MCQLSSEGARTCEPAGIAASPHQRTVGLETRETRRRQCVKRVKAAATNLMRGAAYVSMREQHTSACVKTAAAYVSMRETRQGSSDQPSSALVFL